ncbi:MAG: hypothetical protein AAF467_28210 [Actinomycetota bacterium]
MTPTLVGRIQTRLVLLATVGLAWTIVVVPFLPRFGASVPAVYSATITALFLVAIFGVGWECLYHWIQQYRWEKDWPILFSFALGLLESIPVLIVLAGTFQPAPPIGTFYAHFVTTWIVVWLTAVGPFRVFVLRWRFNGGRLL